ncbi:hypothetical protein HAL07_06820 [Helicobacter ailurogastricus]|uniref:Uncharacterized protein n=1 Tax=Helicobacter ailurogastricus TaxID=1578720 RepID=A0A0K2Y3F6_9HELI|nr:hypothetical protein HAL07_06820 [Helicobacter ailurogastricus]
MSWSIKPRRFKACLNFWTFGFYFAFCALALKARLWATKNDQHQSLTPLKTAD